MNITYRCGAETLYLRDGHAYTEITDELGNLTGHLICYEIHDDEPCFAMSDVESFQ